MTATLRERFAPWAGFIAGPTCWALHQQGFTSLLHFDCHLGSPGKGLLSFAVLTIVLLAGGLMSWRARRGAELRQFIAMTSTLAAALFFFAIALQTVATLILPGCGA
ncbi:MAG TPA: hypothetical protein VHW73_04830 [Rudaea sp.]|nr:hypothetical protein [Rudaea sp.]